MTLDEYLTERGETQVDFGHRAGVRQQLVSRWAAGGAIPRPAWMFTVERLTAGQVTMSDFYHAHAARQRAVAGRVAALAAGAAETDAARIEDMLYATTLAEVRRTARSYGAGRAAA